MIGKKSVFAVKPKLIPGKGLEGLTVISTGTHSEEKHARTLFPFVFQLFLVGDSSIKSWK